MGEDQWWIGARSYTGHSEEHPGEWVWENSNTTVQWFDWAPNQPDDYHRQQCMAYIRYTSLGMTYTYHWNDWDCNSQLADYICEAPFGSPLGQIIPKLVQADFYMPIITPALTLLYFLIIKLVIIEIKSIFG